MNEQGSPQIQVQIGQVWTHYYKRWVYFVNPIQNGALKVNNTMKAHLRGANIVVTILYCSFKGALN
jgi:hypothetical protein